MATALACLLVAASAAASTATFGVSLRPATQYDTSHAVAPVAPGFVGVSMEYCELLTGVVDRASSGATPAASPVLANLIAGLAPGQRPVLRIGGDSTDHVNWSATARAPRRLGRCPFRRYVLGPATVSAIGALARSLDARLILGINLKSRRTSLASVEAAVLSRALGPTPLTGFIDAFEIGNEPDLYSQYRSSSGFDRYLSDFATWAATARGGARQPAATVAGPSLGRLGLPWITGANASNWQRFVQSHARPRLLTFHTYPLLKNACPGALCPSIPALMAEGSSHGLAEQLAPFVAATPAPAQVRVDEMNSVTGKGLPGVSDTFASALWSLDTLFELKAAGVSGVNVHTIPGAPYALFDHLSGDRWVVRPEYYGLLLFGLASPPGSQLLSASGNEPGVKVWATRPPAGGVRIVIINKDRLRHRIILYGPAAHAHGFTVMWLRGSSKFDAARCPAPYVASGMCARAGITLGGRSFGAPARGSVSGDRTVTGTLGAPARAPLAQCGSDRDASNCLLPGPDSAVVVTLPPASAAMLQASA